MLAIIQEQTLKAAQTALQGGQPWFLQEIRWHRRNSSSAAASSANSSLTKITTAFKPHHAAGIAMMPIQQLTLARQRFATDLMMTAMASQTKESAARRVILALREYALLEPHNAQIAKFFAFQTNSLLMKFAMMVLTMIAMEALIATMQNARPVLPAVKLLYAGQFVAQVASYAVADARHALYLQQHVQQFAAHQAKPVLLLEHAHRITEHPDSLTFNLQTTPSR